MDIISKESRPVEDPALRGRTGLWFAPGRGCIT